MLPPTIITAPTSEIALPKPDKIIVNMIKKLCLTSIIATPVIGILNAQKWFLNRRQFSLNNSYDYEDTIGKIIITCATIIAKGVYNNCKTPNGPFLANKKYTIRPTTTGGIPIRAFKIIIIVLLN